LDTRE
jgi:hypothetical protein